MQFKYKKAIYLFSTSILLCSQMIPTIVQAEEIYETNTVENILSYAGLDIKEEVKNLFEDNEETELKETVQGSDIDNIKQKIYKLKDSEEKQQLLEKIALAMSLLQEIIMKGYSNVEFAKLDFTKYRIRPVQPHWGFYSDVYTSVKVARDDKTIFEKNYVANVTQKKSQEEVRLNDGDLVTLTHREADDTRFEVNHSNLQPNNRGYYTYEIIDGQLVEITNKISAAENSVASLFNGTEPKKNNTQEKINDAKNKVNELPNGINKTKLLEQIKVAEMELQKMQQEASESVDRLFDKGIPKVNTTQADLYYAKLKVNTLNSSNLKKELLNKLKIVENKINHRVIETTAVPINIIN